MEDSACGGFFQGLMDDESLINQWMTNSHEDLSALLLPAAATTFLDNDLQHSLLYDYQQPPAKQLIKTNSWDSSCLIDPKPSPDTHNNSAAVAASFWYPANPPLFTIGNSRLDCPVWNSENNHILRSGHDHQGAKKRKFRITSDAATTRSSGAQDHIVAERKRREKLSQRIIALSAVVPGLKKKDKASVLAEAIKYLKQLQERVKILEEQTKLNKTTQSAVVRKAKLIIVDDDANQKPFTGEMFVEGTPTEELLLEIEARVCERNVLIRIHCDKKKGVLEKTLSEIVKLRMTLVSSSVITFGSSALDITIAAQMEEECCQTAKGLVKALRMALTCSV